MIDLRRLGSTKLRVAPISLGTVALGVDYGIESMRGESVPSKDEAINLIRFAVDNGVNLVDTAPNYGLAEERVGEALRKYPIAIIATKVSFPVDGSQKIIRGQEASDAIFTSLRNSLKHFSLESIDLVQIHNATAELIADNEIIDILLEAKKQGLIRHLGVSVYGEEAALEAIDSGVFESVQVAYNLLDRTMEQKVFPLALEKGVGIIVRSAFLKGALSEKVLELPASLDPLKQSVINLREDMNLTWEQLPTLALRFCMSHPAVSTVLIGARTISELQQAIHAVNLGILDDNVLDSLAQYVLADERMTNPSFWQIS